MMLSVSKGTNISAYSLLYDTVERFDGKDGVTYAFISGEIHALFVVNVITAQQYHELSIILDNKFYGFPIV